MDPEEAGGLLQRALDGDQDALSRLVAVLTPVIQARAARTLLPRRSGFANGRSMRQEVEDATQEIFLLLFSNNARILRSWQAERGLSLENFVGLVTQRQVLSFLRSGKRNPWREEPFEAEEVDVVTPEPGPEQVTASREQLRLVLDRLQAEVSPRGWRIFELLFVKELPLQEVMAASGLSSDAVYAWRSRLRRLANHLLADPSGKAQPTRTPGEAATHE